MVVRAKAGSLDKYLESSSKAVSNFIKITFEKSTQVLNYGSQKGIKDQAAEKKNP